MTMPDANLRIHAVQFRGSAGEFFNIWFVNLVLTLLTLGVYSAWAKVRTRRYLYGNTYLFGSSFEYLAEPWQILKGRMVATVVFVLLALAGHFVPTMNGVLVVALLLLTPWIIIRTMRFNLSNTAFRNIRFGFDGQYRRALRVFIGLPVLVAMSGGLAYPYFARQRKRFLIDNSRFGNTPFALHADTMDFYRPYFNVALAAAIYGTSMVLLAVASGVEWRVYLAKPEYLIPYVLIFGILPFAVAYAYLSASITNVVFGNTRLQAYQFVCTLQTSSLFLLYLSNLLGVILSFGLLAPWAIIRTQRYKLSCIAVRTAGDFDGFVAGVNAKTAAVGEELSDLFDIDIGL